MAPTARLPPKKDVALALLEQASMYIHLDPRAEAVQVPAWFKKQPQLVLQVGLNMAVPIPDLRVDEQGLSCTLSFNRAPFFCMIPWRAVFALVGEKGQAMVWAEDVPAEVAAQAQAQKQPERPRGHLRPVADGEGAPTAAGTAPQPEDAGELKSPPQKSGKKAPRAPIKEAKALAAPKRASKASAKAKLASKPLSKKTDTSKIGAAKKPSLPKPSPKKALEIQPAPKQSARPKAAVAAAKHGDKPMAARGASEGAKPKRELPPYLRVVK